MCEIDRILERKREYYKVLNVQENATEAEIKKSYKSLVLKVHPDRNKDPRASEAFSVLTKAYENMKKGVTKESHSPPPYAEGNTYRNAYGNTQGEGYTYYVNYNPFEGYSSYQQEVLFRRLVSEYYRNARIFSNPGRTVYCNNQNTYYRYNTGADDDTSNVSYAEITITKKALIIFFILFFLWRAFFTGSGG